MRKFSEQEKNTIKLIVQGAENSLSYVLINAYNDIFYQQKVKYKVGSSDLLFYRDHTSIHSDELLSIEKVIIEISILLNYLKENRYIYIIEEEHQTTEENNIVGKFNSNNLKCISMPIPQDISKILSEAATHRIFVSPDLIYLAENGFKTIEEETLEEAKKQTKNAKIQAIVTIIVMIVTSIASILISIFHTNTVKLDDLQSNKGVEAIHLINEKMSQNVDSTTNIIIESIKNVNSQQISSDDSQIEK